MIILDRVEIWKIYILINTNDFAPQFFIIQSMETIREEGELSESEDDSDEQLDENIHPNKLNVSWDGLN